jgi:hypothetical protein
MQIKNLVQIELLLKHSKRFEALILKTSSYFSFENLKHKLWPKVKLVVYFTIIKTQKMGSNDFCLKHAIQWTKCFFKGYDFSLQKISIRVCL